MEEYGTSLDHISRITFNSGHAIREREDKCTRMWMELWGILKSCYRGKNWGFAQLKRCRSGKSSWPSVGGPSFRGGDTEDWIIDYLYHRYVSWTLEAWFCLFRGGSLYPLHLTRYQPRLFHHEGRNILVIHHTIFDKVREYKPVKFCLIILYHF